MSTKILHLSRSFYPLTGGTESYILETSRRLCEHGIISRVLTIDHDIHDKSHRLASRDVVDGIEIYRVPAIGYYKKPIPLQVPFNLFGWADVVNVQDIRFFYETALILKNLYHYKLLVTTHGFVLHTEEFKAAKSLAISLFYKRTFSTCVDGLVATSQADFDFFKSWRVRKLFLTESSVDLKPFATVKRSPSAGNLLYFGRLDHNKGIETLLRALSTIDEGVDWHLDAVGTGASHYTFALKSLSYELGIDQRVTWHGYQSDAALKKFLSRAALCLFPSSYESFGLTLVEAMATGAVCLANTIPAYESVIRDRFNGRLVAFSDANKTADMILQLLRSDDSVLRDISAHASDSSLQYDWERRIEQVLEVYRALD